MIWFVLLFVAFVFCAVVACGWCVSLCVGLLCSVVLCCVVGVCCVICYAGVFVVFVVMCCLRLLGSMCCVVSLCAVVLCVVLVWFYSMWCDVLCLFCFSL